MQTPTQQIIHKRKRCDFTNGKEKLKDFPHVIYLSRNMNRVKDDGATDIYSRIIHETCWFRCVSAHSSQQRKGRSCPDRMSDVT